MWQYHLAQGDHSPDTEKCHGIFLIFSRLYAAFLPYVALRMSSIIISGTSILRTLVQKMCRNSRWFIQPQNPQNRPYKEAVWGKQQSMKHWRSPKREANNRQFSWQGFFSDTSLTFLQQLSNSITCFTQMVTHLHLITVHSKDRHTLSYA